jgi:hypothetical protein
MRNILDISLFVRVFLEIHFISSAVSINVDLPPEHLPFYFSSYPNLEADCDTDPNCPYKV